MSALVLHTRGDGILGDTSPEEVTRIAAQVAAAPRPVIHIHGGLVKKAAGLAGAQRLDGYYRPAGLLPVFPVWESGLFETVLNNAKEIFDEKLFQALLKRLLKHAGGKLLQSAGGRAANTYEPLTDRDAEIALAEARAAPADQPRAEPLRDVVPPSPPSELTAEEEKLLADELAQSGEFQDAVDSVMLGLNIPPPPGGRAPAVPIAPAKSLLSGNIKDELRASAQPGARGWFDPVSLIKHAVVVLARVIRRFVQKRDHGLYTTVVEETVRELYIDAIGRWVWGRMKKDTEDTFVDAGSGAQRGGSLFLRELAAQLRQRQSSGQSLPRLSLVAHSAGSIWACHFLRSLGALRDTGMIPAEFCVDRLIFLAPACTSALFSKTLVRHNGAKLFNEFRLFALSDGLEAGYWEAPPLYPRSLLYMVSGLFEDTVDQPLVGMQRYVANAAVYNDSDEKAVREFVSAPAARSVWSRDDRGVGLATDSATHSDFDETGSGKPMKTMHSVVHLLTT